MTNATQRPMTIRQNFEHRQIRLCLIGLLGTYGLYLWSPQSSIASLSASILLTFIAITKLPGAVRRWSFDLRLIGCRKPWMTYKQAIAKAKKAQKHKKLWLGMGFAWKVEQCQQANDLLSMSWESLFRDAFHRTYPLRYFLNDPLAVIRSPIRSLAHCLNARKAASEEMGDRWIHSLGKDQDIEEALANFAGHTLLVGTTGCGKTRALELFMLQAILRGDPVLILDPKGDDALERAAKNLCEACGRANDFQRLHLAYPEYSVHLNLMANYSEITELADRVTNTIAGGKTEPVFKEKGNAAMRNVCRGQEIIGEPVTPDTILHYLQKRTELAEKTLGAHIREILGPEEFQKLCPSGISPTNKLEILKRLYEQKPEKFRNSAVDNILAFSQEDSNNLTQMIQGTLSQLEKLSSGTVGKLICPQPEDHTTPFTDLRTLLQQNGVLYVGLTAMRDEAIAHAVGSLLLADLTALASSIYSYDHQDINEPHIQVKENKKRVWIFADEASELVCPSLIALLNKGRGAGMHICLATQTYADFVSRLGSSDDATTVIANLNNLIVLRCNDAATAESITSRLPEVHVRTRSQSIGMSTDADNWLTQRGNYSQMEGTIPVKLVSSSLLASLPNLEYFGLLGGSHVVKGRLPILLRSRREYRK